MAYTDAQNRATQKYIAANLEEVRFRVQKGQKAVLQDEAQKVGLSMAQYLVKAVNSYAGKQILTPSGSKMPPERTESL